MGSNRLETVQISARSRGHDLPHLLGNAFRTPVGRVPIFLDLRRQRAGPSAPEAGIDDSTELSGHRPGEATPFKGRVAIGIFRIEKLTIFNKPQRVDQKRGDLLETPINRRRIRCGLERAARTILQHQACLRLFVINGIATRLDEAQQSRRLNRLPDDLEIAGLQAMNQGRHISVAQASIVWSRAEEISTAGLAPGLISNFKSATARWINSEFRCVLLSSRKIRAHPSSKLQDIARLILDFRGRAEPAILSVSHSTPGPWFMNCTDTRDLHVVTAVPNISRNPGCRDARRSMGRAPRGKSR